MWYLGQNVFVPVANKFGSWNMPICVYMCIWMYFFDCISIYGYM